jgi:glutathione S-transferase
MTSSSFDRASNAQKSKDYLKINPNGRIPTQVDGKLIVSEAAAIMLHLVDQHADGGLAPQIGTLERARFYQWMTFLTNSLPEELMISQYPDRLDGRDASAADVVRQGAEGRASRFLDVIEDHLKAKQPTVSRQPAEGRRFLSGHALALDAPDGRPAAFAPQHRNASRQGDGPPLSPTRP